MNEQSRCPKFISSENFSLFNTYIYLQMDCHGLTSASIDILDIFLNISMKVSSLSFVLRTKYNNKYFWHLRAI